jgi:hypothetical protein
VVRRILQFSRRKYTDSDVLRTKLGGRMILKEVEGNSPIK